MPDRPQLEATRALVAAVKGKEETRIESLTVILSGKCGAEDPRPCQQGILEPETIKLSLQPLASTARTLLQHLHLEVEIFPLIGTQDHLNLVPHKLEDMRNLRSSRNTQTDQSLW